MLRANDVHAFMESYIFGENKLLAYLHTLCSHFGCFHLTVCFLSFCPDNLCSRWETWTACDKFLHWFGLVGVMNVMDGRVFSPTVPHCETCLIDTCGHWSVESEWVTVWVSYHLLPFSLPLLFQKHALSGGNSFFRVSSLKLFFHFWRRQPLFLFCFFFRAKSMSLHFLYHPHFLVPFPFKIAQVGRISHLIIVFSQIMRSINVIQHSISLTASELHFLDWLRTTIKSENGFSNGLDCSRPWWHLFRV